MTPAETLEWYTKKRDSFHATYSGGHHNDGHYEAFHHGMDTVFNCLEGDAKRMKETDAKPPTPPQFKVGDRVKVSDTNDFDYGLMGVVIRVNETTCAIRTKKYDAVCDHNQLTLIDPPTPKRVEVVKATREVPVEIIVRLSVSDANLMIDNGDVPTSIRNELQAALTEQDNG